MFEQKGNLPISGPSGPSGPSRASGATEPRDRVTERRDRVTGTPCHRVRMELHQPLASRVAAWREGDLPHKTFPAIAELFAGPLDGDGQEAPSRSLRAAQLRALET